MRICIDCRFWGLEHTGLGRYTMRLVSELMKLDRENEYYLLFRQDVFDEFRTNLPSNFSPVLAEARHYTLKEQWLMGWILWKLKPDILHVPHFNIPVLLPVVLPQTRLVVTIHDLIKQMSVGSATTTLPMPIYWLKYLVVNYWIIKQAVYLSKAIIVPSKFVKQQIVDNFETRNLKLANKIFVTYEAPDSTYFMKSLKPTFVKATVDRHESNKASELLKSYQLKANSYFIYTGNAYPHKNLEKLVEAVKQVVRSQKSEVRSNIKLAIVCARGVFRERVEKFVKEQGMEDMVKFLGFVEDEVLRELYRQSLTFITPSKLEGFGLSGLEAMAAGTVVLSSNASCLPETYGDAAIYFDPDSGEEMVEKIESVLRMRSEERKRLIKLGIKRARGFSWERMAKETLKVYDFAY